MNYGNVGFLSQNTILLSKRNQLPLSAIVNNYNQASSENIKNE